MLLTGYNESFCPEFLVGVNQEDCLPSINAILSGLEIEYDMAYGYVRYLTAMEVKQIAEALSSFNHAHIKTRLELKGWKMEDYNHLFEYSYYPLIAYYQDAAKKSNAMFLYLT